MKKEYVTDVGINKIYRADNEDLNIRNRNGRIIAGSHDVIVISKNKRKKTCNVKTITSLEKEKNGKWVFIGKKLKDVRDGNIIAIPKKQINTDHLSGVNHSAKTIKINKLFVSQSGTKFPRRYKHLIKKK